MGSFPIYQGHLVAGRMLNSADPPHAGYRASWYAVLIRNDVVTQLSPGVNQRDHRDIFPDNDSGSIQMV